MHDREDRIRRKAYELWMEEGQPEGRQSAHWEEASELVAFDEARNTLNPRKLDGDADFLLTPAGQGIPRSAQSDSGCGTKPNGEGNTKAESSPEGQADEAATRKPRSRARASASVSISARSGDGDVFVHREMREESADGSSKAAAVVTLRSRRTRK
jgi:hypothetical protein